MKNSNSSKRDFDQDLDEVLRIRNSIKDDLLFIKEAGKDYNQKRQIRRFSRLKTYSISIAAVFVLGLCMSYILPSLIHLDPNKIFTTHYEKYIPDLETRTSDQENQLTIALNNYQRNESEEAIGIITPLLNKEPDNKLYQYYNALFLTELGKHDQAYSIFGNLVGQSFMTIESLWYMALMDLKKGNWTIAKHHFRQIKSLDNNAHKAEIRRILRRIRMRK